MDAAVLRAAGSRGCSCCPSFSLPSPASCRATSSAGSSSSTPANSSCSFRLRSSEHLQGLRHAPTHSPALPFCRPSAVASLHSHASPRNRIGVDFAVSGFCSRARCLPVSASEEEVSGVPVDEKEGAESSSGRRSNEAEEGQKAKNSKAFQSSWDAKDSQGKDYLYRLGKEADNLNVTVGARSGLIDQIFIGDFLGKDADIVFDYRQKVTRSFQNLQGDFYIAPAFLDKVVTHITKNYLASSLDTQVPLLLGIWGGKGQGKSFQLELICKALGMEPVIMSAGELESEWAGEPGKLIRDRYRTASQVIKNQGKMSALVINDLDAGIGRFENTQCTVNNQMVVGSLMNLADNPTRVSIGQEWREHDIVNRVPIIVTGNDLSTIWAPLIRDGRMDKFYWQPTREDIVNIVHHMYRKDGLSMADIGTIVDTFPNQALDFYGALRSRTYDEGVLKWIDKIGGPEKLGSKLVSRKSSDEPLPTFVAPEATIERLVSAGDSLVKEQRLVNEMRLSDVYMKKQTGGGGLSVLAS